MSTESVYNPLDKNHLAESIVREFFKRPLYPLPPETTFTGAGIYALYYRGSYPLYSHIAASLARFEGSTAAPALREQPIPIYIGKSDPPGSRKGSFNDRTEENEEEAHEVLAVKPEHRKLFERLRKHSVSVKSTNNNLLPTDFQCRYMIVDEVWVALGEAKLVEWFKPVWNGLIEGFGSNPEGGGRAVTARSVWDILHPGRKESLGIQVDPSVEEEIVFALRASSTITELRTAIVVHRNAKIAFARQRRNANPR